MRTLPGLRVISVIVAAQILAGTMAGHATEIYPAESTTLSNAIYRLAIASTNGQVMVQFQDRLSGMTIADGPYLYSAKMFVGEKEQSFRGLENPGITKLPDSLVIRGTLAGLELEHHFTLSSNRLFLEEAISLHNATAHLIALSDFEAGFQRAVVDQNGEALSEFAHDRWVAIPLRARATDPKGFENDFSIPQLINEPGYEPYMNKDLQYTQVPSRHRRAEGWAWIHGDTTLGIFVFNQENLLFSVVSAEKTTNGAALRFGGACMISGEPDALTRIAPGQTVNLGVVRYQSMKGGYLEAAYAFRALLDEKGCRFPKDYNPPVHWEQLYDMNGAWTDRSARYTKAILEQEAEKARAFSCEALYLDPGWDTDFGSLYWGEKWLGPRREFIEEMRSKYGLQVSLHCALATWVSH